MTPVVPTMPGPFVESASSARLELEAALGPDYELRELLGTGGFAEVYAAWDRRLKRDVAVKTLRPELASSPEVIERFRNEAEAIARLRHPHIVPVFSVGEGHGVAYMVMPRIDGVSLADAMRTQEHWSLPEVSRILREAAGALAEAHRVGIVHRDVKPENLMLEGSARRVIVMDFGIAKSADVLAGGLTATGMVVGTPQYMSPEQAISTTEVSPRSDQYSLGVVGYRLLTGRLPFEADTARGLMYQHVAERAPSVRAARPDAPDALVDAIDRALEKDPAKRWPTMEAFADAVSRVAAEVAGEFRMGRRQESWTARVEAARVRLRLSGVRTAASAMVGLAVFGVAYGRAELAEPRRVAGARDEAVAGATRMLREHGYQAGHPRVVYLRLGAPFGFLQSLVGRDSAVALMSDRFAGWGWEVRTYHPERRDWMAVVASPSGDLRAFSSYWPLDTARIPDVSDDSARAMALNMVRSRGWTEDALDAERVARSPATYFTRRTFNWTVPSRSVASGADTARAEIVVSLHGNRLTSYREVFAFPGPFRAGLPPKTVDALRATGKAIGVVLFFLACWMALRRNARDSLQWGTVGWLAAATFVATIVAWLLPELPRRSVPWGDASRLAIMMDLFMDGGSFFLARAALAAAMVLAGESLVNERRPDVLAGLTDVTRGRFAIPEMLTSALSGYAAALLSLAGVTAALAIARMYFGVPFDSLLSNWSYLDYAFPSLTILGTLASSIVLGGIVLFLLGLMLHYRVPLWTTCLAWGVLFALARLDFGPVSDARVLAESAAVALLPWFVLRRGMLAGLVALFAFMSGPIVADMLWAGGPFTQSGMLALAWVLVPAAAAFAVHRTLGRETPHPAT